MQADECPSNVSSSVSIQSPRITALALLMTIWNNYVRAAKFRKIFAVYGAGNEHNLPTWRWADKLKGASTGPVASEVRSSSTGCHYKVRAQCRLKNIQAVKFNQFEGNYTCKTRQTD
ncbi:hypothetical protein CUMW_053620 [Citrus unshiu]|uniref:Uncharacterized protein n=1 Tax=Citrus sinensis TaxID=2711 RepID=A0A067FMV3_CITSI|nr:hypothetical protein CISIN_1g033574mg [Citrus sinensis]GAY40653.1 hypothetical protein CUMW_053620 [Citrus unshiu]